jgi:APA family basic amino acid/polyamine antiporter
VRDPERNLPRAILIGVLCVIAVYVGANVAYVHVLGAADLAATKTPAADVAARLLGEPGARAISLLIVVSTFGFLNHALLAAPRVYYAMAADGLFFRSLARLSPRFRAPTAAILLQGALAAVFALTSSYDRLLSYAVFADWVFFALSGAALLVFRRKLPDAPRPVPVPWYPWVPLLFSLAGAGIVVNIFFTDTRNALMGTAIFALGIPVYFFWRFLGRKRDAA